MSRCGRTCRSSFVYCFFLRCCSALVAQREKMMLSSWNGWNLNFPIRGSYFDGWWWFFLPASARKSSVRKMDFNKFRSLQLDTFFLCASSFTFASFLFFADFGESFIKNDPVQTLRNFSSSRIISQRWVHKTIVHKPTSRGNKARLIG